MSTAEFPVLARSLTGFSAAIRAHGLIRFREDAFKAARRHPSPIPQGWGPIPASTLRAADEQTVAAVSAVLGAISGWQDPSPDEFAAWGVVAASRFLGRSHLVVDLKRFFAEGVWGVSPHIIPHFALHSQAGTLSQILNLHGPNLGVGGGPDAAFQGALTALTWLSGGEIPGVWLVLSGWSPELVPDTNGRPTSDCECQALALALVPLESADDAWPRLRIDPADSVFEAGGLDLVDLAADLDRRRLSGDPPSRRTLAADPGGRLRLQLVAGLGDC